MCIECLPSCIQVYHMHAVFEKASGAADTLGLELQMAVSP